MLKDLLRRPKSWANAGFDLKDPSLVFYAPFHLPNMVAQGGSIVNGTGTMDVSPQNPAVGANTITVTAAGTLIVTMPEGGTVASGTMTVTASPVTVSAGVATTITTTGATGNITVTPSNIIRSRDTNNHALTITGATWGLQGRTFDGNDVIDCGNAASLQTGTGAFSEEIWVRWSDLTGEQHFFSKSTTRQLAKLNTTNLLYFGDGTSGLASTFAMTVGVWYHIVATYNGTNTTSLIINGLLDGTATKTLTSADASNLFIGAWNVAGDYGVRGIIGEARAYNRVVSLGEGQRSRLATKWRY